VNFKDFFFCEIVSVQSTINFRRDFQFWTSNIIESKKLPISTWTLAMKECTSVSLNWKSLAPFPPEGRVKSPIACPTLKSRADVQRT